MAFLAVLIAEYHHGRHGSGRQEQEEDGHYAPYPKLL